MKIDKKRLQLLLKVLPEGEDNAISLETLSRYFGVTERDIRSLILNARQNGYMICSLPSEQKGYYLPANNFELLRCYRMFRKRAESTASILQGMKDYLLKNGIDPDRDKKGGRV
ncbi:MAG: hypothetical protein K6E53_16745 [Lachnospiraceae bacterium]|nr:hypothetical protein [Lachnospiraceae bacterium]